MLLKSTESALLVIDVQQKLLPFISNAEEVEKNCGWLMAGAKEMNVPILVSEQYPKGLGATVRSLQTWYEEKDCVSKVHFSCGSDAGCVEKIKNLRRKQLVLIGIEAHVCVMQTAMELAEDYDVFVVADAIGSRNNNDKNIALQRMQQNGIVVVTKEMVLFEWLEKAGTDVFKMMSQKFLRS